MGAKPSKARKKGAKRLEFLVYNKSGCVCCLQAKKIDIFHFFCNQYPFRLIKFVVNYQLSVIISNFDIFLTVFQNNLFHPVTTLTFYIAIQLKYPCNG